MNTYKVGIVYEQGGYMTIQAKSTKDAENKALEILENNGSSPVDDFDTTHRDYYTILDTQKV